MFHEFLTGTAVNDLGWRSGAVYLGVVKVLLGTDFPGGDGGALVQAFDREVLVELDSIII
jgi:hypothetical protein